MDNIDLNKPAFGPDSQILEEKPEVTPAEVSQPKEEIKDEEVHSDESVEEQKVPYSRFKKYHEKAQQAEREAFEWKAKYEAFQESRAERAETSQEIPDYWVELYGDSEASKKAWKIQDRQNQEFYQRIKEEAKEEALNAVREESQRESVRMSENLEHIDSQLEELSSSIGRDITSKEESALLDIVDEFTPKDEDGNYIGATIPFDKAWEIYEMKQNSVNAIKRESRDKIAALNSTSSQGETSNAPEKDKNFNPLDWGAWKSKI